MCSRFFTVLSSGTARTEPWRHTLPRRLGYHLIVDGAGHEHDLVRRLVNRLPTKRLGPTTSIVLRRGGGRRQRCTNAMPWALRSNPSRRGVSACFGADASPGRSGSGIICTNVAATAPVLLFVEPAGTGLGSANRAERRAERLPNGDHDPHRTPYRRNGSRTGRPARSGSGLQCRRAGGRDVPPGAHRVSSARGMRVFQHRARTRS